MSTQATTTPDADCIDQFNKLVTSAETDVLHPAIEAKVLALASIVENLQELGHLLRRPGQHAEDMAIDDALTHLNVFEPAKVPAGLKVFLVADAVVGASIDWLIDALDDVVVDAIDGERKERQ